MTKIVFKTELGFEFDTEDVNSLVNYNARTGDYPDSFTEKDWDLFEKKYVKPFRAGLSSDRDLNR